MINTDKSSHVLRQIQPISFECFTGTLVVMIGNAVEDWWHAVNFKTKVENSPIGKYYATIQYRFCTNKKILMGQKNVSKRTRFQANYVETQLSKKRQKVIQTKKCNAKKTVKTNGRNQRNQRNQRKGRK